MDRLEIFRPPYAFVVSRAVTIQQSLSLNHLHQGQPRENLKIINFKQDDKDLRSTSSRRPQARPLLDEELLSTVTTQRREHQQTAGTDAQKRRVMEPNGDQKLAFKSWTLPVIAEYNQALQFQLLV